MVSLDDYPELPRRFRWPVPAGQIHPNGTQNRWRTGSYFPLTNLTVTDMGGRGTGAPIIEGLEWIDEAPEEVVFGGARAHIIRSSPTMGEMLGQPKGGE